ncbi:hypothetical protein PIB30_101120 [Stylosanthes scabra]|uniref:Uncharacterized protein n=1 Tax=Stylosanthes scabra TaxID=79078 RepID=A0ABU6YZ84_9FABA|nr:hypothetical protein [Stylosanthes scabra]
MLIIFVLFCNLHFETRGKEQEKLQTELKKLQKLKEFKPTMNLPLLKDKEQQDKKDKKKRLSAPYILWCKRSMEWGTYYFNKYHISKRQGETRCGGGS